MSTHSSPATTHRYDLDFLRVVAMLSVIGIHCMMPIVEGGLPTNDGWLIADTIDTALRWCVPVFVMISGALLIRPSTFSHARVFYQRRVARILLPLLAWPLLYWAWAVLVPGLDMSWQDIGLAFLAGSPLVGTHLYFLFIIAGLYVLAPLISLYAASVSRRAFRWSAIAALAVASCWLILEVKVLGRADTYNLFTWCLPFIGYFMLGHSLKDVRLTRRQLIIAAVIFVATATTGALLGVYSRIEGNMFYQSYLSPIIIVLSLIAFVGGRALYARLGTPLLDRGLGFAARLSFGVYLVHVLILNSLVHWLQLDITQLSSGTLLFVLTVPLSILAVWGMQYVPGVRRLVT